MGNRVWLGVFSTAIVEVALSVAIAAVALGLLAGCGGGSGTKTTTAGVTSTGRTTASSSSPAGTSSTSSRARSAAQAAKAVVKVCHSGAGGTPANAVVRICANTITKATVEHAMAVGAVLNKTSLSAKVVMPDQPPYKACIANLAATAPKPAKGQPMPTLPQMKAECARQYKSLLPQALHQLIQREWVFDEALLVGVRVSDAEVHQAFIQKRNVQFSTVGEFEKYLKRSGETMSDVLLHVRYVLTSKKLQQNVVKGGGTFAAGKQPSGQEAFSIWVTEFRKRWKAQTDCRTGYVVEDCKQFKTPERTTMAHPTRTLSFNETAQVHLTSNRGSILYQRGTVSGTIKGTIDVNLSLASSSRLIAEVKIYSHGGSLLIAGAAGYQQSGRLTTFSGTLAVGRGTGSYRAARSSSLTFTGTIDRQNHSGTALLSGELSF